MVKTNTSKLNASDKTTNNQIISLGEFWVDSDGEVFIDLTDPIPGLQNATRYRQIEALRRKLQTQNEQHTPPNTPLKHSNRTREAQWKGKGY